MKRGTTEAMREAGEHLIVGHSLLDESTRKVAPELNITLPNRASPQQQQFVATVVGSTGKQFDTNAANIMRVTHGQIFPAIAKIRATTKNTLVRQLADQANDVVLDHITVLEKTGLVNFDQANFQQTSPPKLPKAELTPPAPQPGEPVTALTAPPAWRTSTRTFRHSTRRRGDRTGGRGGSSGTVPHPAAVRRGRADDHPPASTTLRRRRDGRRRNTRPPLRRRPGWRRARQHRGATVLVMIRSTVQPNGIHVAAETGP